MDSHAPLFPDRPAEGKEGKRQHSLLPSLSTNDLTTGCQEGALVLPCSRRRQARLEESHVPQERRRHGHAAVV